MRKLKTIVVVGALALVALAAMSATAGAFRVAVEAGGAISSASLGNLTFRGTITITCPVTLNGSLLRGPITIAAGERIGEITEVRVNNERCTNGTVREILVGTGERAWTVLINSVPAGLPNSATAVEIKVVDAKFKLSTFGGFINCLYRGDAPASLAVAHIRGQPENVYSSGLISVLRNTQSLVEGGGCPSTGEFGGTFGLTPTQTLTVS